MKLTVFGKIMAGILAAALITAIGCAGALVEGNGSPAHQTALIIALAAAFLIAALFNLERRRP